jgi:hypothetical protein
MWKLRRMTSDNEASFSRFGRSEPESVVGWLVG